jgi:hypothetical protein
MNKPVLLDTIWLMITADGFYPIQPTSACKPEDHARLNDRILSIQDAFGNEIWKRAIQ